MCSVSAESWHKTREELARMFEYISKLTPHNVKETVDFNVTLRVSEELVRKLPELLADLETEKEEMEKVKCHLEYLQKNKKLLEDKVRVQKAIFEQSELPYPELQCKEYSKIYDDAYFLVDKYKGLDNKEKATFKEKLLKCIEDSSCLNFCRKYRNKKSNHEIALIEESACNKLIESDDVKKKLAECKSEEQEFNTLLEESQKRIELYNRACATINKALQV
ncbi:Hypothetical protein GL50581_3222 [Giardia duodenalis ATCC 50581]|uniref:Uncharacterized protein n=1 Tax=Giardia intestinalis (strain ATCC 50581 / GS clone H7) TaxID=598745 RepID=C6LWR1_GIAIB|nr:Hypothetical protein GL50581_3222 [Giardia intestinalis ATCC 50581]